MQVVRGPVGSHIRAMTPDAADFLAADRLPNVLSVANVFAAEENGSVSRHDLRGDGRAGVDTLVSDASKYSKRGDEHHRQGNPEFLILAHSRFLPLEICRNGLRGLSTQMRRTA